MAENAIEYGESLLADIRKRNDDARRTQERINRQNKWKEFAIGIGTQIAQDYTKNKQLEFLNNEEALKQQMLLKDSNDSAEKVLANFETAKTHVGGEQAYFDTQLKNQLDTMLSQKYGEGSRNETTYQQILNKLVRENSDAYYEGQVKLRDLSRDYAASGNAEAYKENRQTIAGDGTIKGTIANKLSRLTGVLDVDLYKEKNAEIVKKSEAFQTNYQTIFNQTKDVLLAEAVAEISSDDIGVPAPEVIDTYTYKSTDILGNVEERRVTVMNVSSRNEDGTVIKRPVELVVGDFGYQQLTERRKNNEYTLNQIAGGLSEKVVKMGLADYLDMKTPNVQAVNEIIKADLLEKENMKKNDPGYPVALQTRQENFVRNRIAAGMKAEAEEFATAREGEKIYTQMVINRMRDEEVRGQGIADIGSGNIFETMYAIQDLVEAGELNGRRSLAILGENMRAMYEDLKVMNKTQRDIIFAELGSQDYTEGKFLGLFGGTPKKGVNFFEGQLESDAFKVNIMTLQRIVDNQETYNLERFKGDFNKMTSTALDDIKAEVTAEQKRLEEEEKKKQQKAANITQGFQPVVPVI